MSARRYRKKPVEIEAVRFDGHNGPIIELWSGGKVIPSPVLEPTHDNPTGAYLQVVTLEGVMTVNMGDWIIRGVAGEFYPCRNDIFERTYEEVLSVGPECVTCGYDPRLCDQA